MTKEQSQKEMEQMLIEEELLSSDEIDRLHQIMEDQDLLAPYPRIPEDDLSFLSDEDNWEYWEDENNVREFELDIAQKRQAEIK